MASDEQSPNQGLPNSSNNAACTNGSADQDKTDSGATTTDGDNNNEREESTLDFAKREISDIHGRRSYSQLSSLTKSPEGLVKAASGTKKHIYQDGHGAHNRRVTRVKDSSHESSGIQDDVDEYEPIIEPDNQERIRNPASQVFRKSNPREKIGFRQPFGDNEMDSSSSNGSNTHNGGSSTQTSPTDLTSTFGFQTNRRRKRYEPARVVLHKSDLGLDDSTAHSNNNGNIPSEPPSRSSSIVPLNSSGSPELIGRGSIPQSLVSSLSGSPDEHGLTSIKHLREPKQPIYIPAVLRPTDFDSYHSQVGNNKYSSDAPRKPITQHWVRDAFAKSCRACERQFTWYRRRHHCRKCGGVFCSTDTKHTIGLDRVLNFNILGMPCRACDVCAAEFSGFCLDAPRLRDGPVSSQQPIQGPEQEEAEVGDGGDWSTF